MKKKILITSAVVITGVITFVMLSHAKLHPVIKSYGPVFDVPFATLKPDTLMPYKIVADCGVLNEKPIEKPDEIYSPLEHIARMYNLHIYGGVKQENLELNVVIWGQPITTILNNEAYREKYGVDNPNIKIISEMKQAGVNFYACAQSIEKSGIDPAAVNPDITIAVSRFTAVSTFQMKGYAYFQYNK